LHVCESRILKYFSTLDSAVWELVSATRQRRHGSFSSYSKSGTANSELNLKSERSVCRGHPHRHHKHSSLRRQSQQFIQQSHSSRCRQLGHLFIWAGGGGAALSVKLSWWISFAVALGSHMRPTYSFRHVHLWVCVCDTGIHISLTYVRYIQFSVCLNSERWLSTNWWREI